MNPKRYQLEKDQPFSESILWEINRQYYQSKGPKAFSEDIVPHHLTTNSFSAKAYAEIIFGVLKDLASKGQTEETVHILELGAGHGRLAFLILTHLELKIEASAQKLPPFCCILSDIVEDNLDFFSEHAQLLTFIKQGVLDVAYFDAIKGKSLKLRHAQKTICTDDLSQPIIALANCFFDSIPSDLFFAKDGKLFNCSISIDTPTKPNFHSPEELIDNMNISYQNLRVTTPTYANSAFSTILQDYKHQLSNTYFLYPAQAMRCIKNIRSLSKKGLFLLSMDKGFHNLDDLKNNPVPDLVAHGSFSVWVNFHALAAYCKMGGGMSLFSSYSNFHLEMGLLMFSEDAHSFVNATAAYHESINEFGPADFNSIKKQTYLNASNLNLRELIALIRLSAYDPTFFIRLLPQCKLLCKSISTHERQRIDQTINMVWAEYFSIGEEYDLPYELGGLFYELGFYDEAITYFHFSLNLHGNKPDTYYNLALSYYQLRKDALFTETVLKAKSAFPKYELFTELDFLDMS